MKRLLFILVALFFVANTVLHATIYHVKPTGNDAANGKSWATAFQHLQTALDFAQFGDTVFVAEGTYKPTRNAFDGNLGNSRDNAFVLKANVSIYGGFPANANDIIHTTPHDRNWSAHPTVLSGDIGNVNNIADNCYHVVVSAGDVGIADRKSTRLNSSHT